jgi:ABC-type Fe3+-hydroxamate transport system substrate-binding protein
MHKTIVLKPPDLVSCQVIKVHYKLNHRLKLSYLIPSSNLFSATYTRSIRIMGDIYRKKMEVEKAFNQYEQSMAAAQRLGDRLAQMESMDGIARCLEILR